MIVTHHDPETRTVKVLYEDAKYKKPMPGSSPQEVLDYWEWKYMMLAAEAYAMPQRAKGLDALCVERDKAERERNIARARVRALS